MEIIAKIKGFEIIKSYEPNFIVFTVFRIGSIFQTAQFRDLQSAKNYIKDYYKSIKN
jgi:hypothetical protein